MDLHNIREEYRKKVLSQQECNVNPIIQFEHWLDDAIKAQVNEPTGMNLATINENGRPSSRMVLLKEVNAQGFVFFTNYHSRKGLAIEQHSFVALTFFWPELERSVRIEGKAEKIPAEQSDAYFASRPYTSRIGAQHPFNVPRPPHWGGYLVTPDRIEFWQGRPSRLHDRICYLLENGEWKKVRLSP